MNDTPRKDVSSAPLFGHQKIWEPREFWGPRKFWGHRKIWGPRKIWGLRGGLALILALMIGFGAAVGVGAGNALAQGVAGGHDTGLPIEIEADQLTVEQASDRATFAGNVVVVQGDLTLRAERLTVEYALGGDSAVDQAIRRIEAEGGVTMASARETATGNRGVYDVRDGSIVITGDVTLTRDDNVIKGGKLTIDLESSVATMSAGESAGSGRVRALFVPDKGKP